MKTLTYCSLALIAGIVTSTTVGVSAAQAQTVNVHFTAVVHESCQTQGAAPSALSSSSSACNVQQETITVVVDTEAAQQVSQPEQSQAEATETTVTQVTTVVR